MPAYSFSGIPLSAIVYADPRSSGECRIKGLFCPISAWTKLLRTGKIWHPTRAAHAAAWPAKLPFSRTRKLGRGGVLGEKKYYLANLPARMDLCSLAATIKERWICEQAHQQLKEELGLDHFEGRSWQGLHRHVPRHRRALRSTAASAMPALPKMDQRETAA